MLASWASATTLPATACSRLAMFSGLSIRTSTAPAATFSPRVTGMSATRPSMRAAMSSRVASTSPWTSSGCGRTRNQIESPAMTATMTPTMMEETRLARGALSPGAARDGAAPAGAGGAGSSTSVGWASVRGVCIPQLPVKPGEARHAVAPEDPRPERYDRVEIRASALEAIDVIVMRLGDETWRIDETWRRYFGGAWPACHWRVATGMLQLADEVGALSASGLPP